MMRNRTPYFCLTLLCWLFLCDAFSQPGGGAQQSRPVDLTTIRALPDGGQKLLNIVRYTRNPANYNPESETLLDDGITYARLRADGAELLPQLLTNKAQFLIYKNAHSDAEALLDEAASYIDGLSQVGKLESLNALAVTYRRINAFAKALAAHERHDAITKGNTDPGMVVDRITNLQNMVSLFLVRNEMDRVRACNAEVQQLMQYVDDSRVLFNFKFNLAATLVNIDETEEATELLNELMLEIVSNTDGRAARFYELVAENAYRQGNMHRAAEYYTKVHQLPTSNPQQKLRSANQLLYCYIGMDQADSVAKYIQRSRELKTNPAASYGNAVQWLAEAQFAVYQGNIPEAKAHYLKAVSLSAPGHPENLVSHTGLAQLYLRENQPDSGRFYVDKVKDHVQLPNIPRYLKIQYYELAGALHADVTRHGMAKDSAIAALNHQLILKDSLYDQASLAAYAEMESRYNLQAKERLLQLARQREEIQALEIKRHAQRVWIIVLSGSIALGLLGTTTLVLLLRRRQARERHEAQLQQLAQQHRVATARTLRQAGEEERKRIASKLHDEVGSLLSIARLNVKQIEGDVFTAGSDAIVKIQTTQKILSEVGETVRNISHSLMPVALEKQGLKPAILDLLKAMGAAGTLTMEDVIEGLEDTNDWDKEFCLGLYRIVQEILNNIIKHARATHLLVQIVEFEHAITIYIEDNGIGLNMDLKTDGLGLKLLKTNVEYLNGAIEINGRENQGTFVMVELPLIRNNHPS